MKLQKAAIFFAVFVVIVELFIIAILLNRIRFPFDGMGYTGRFIYGNGQTPVIGSAEPILVIWGTRVSPDDIPPRYEGFLRTVNTPSLHDEPIPNSELYYYGFVIRLNTTYIKINSDGFRDREFPIMKPAGTKRIVMLGDSLTMGMGVNSSDTYPKVLEEKLKVSNSSSSRYEVLNFGVLGYNTKDEVDFLINRALKYSPDIVTITYVCNDVEDNVRVSEIAKKYWETHNLTGRQLTDAENILASTQIWTESAMDVQKNYDHYWSEVAATSLEEFSSLSKVYNFKPVVIYWQCEYAYPQEMVKLKEISERLGFDFIDTSSMFIDHPRSDLALRYPDGHLNPFGNRIMAEKIFEGLKDHALI